MICLKVLKFKKNNLLEKFKCFVSNNIGWFIVLLLIIFILLRQKGKLTTQVFREIVIYKN